MSSETLFDKWINARFDGKLVISVIKRDQYTNLRFSLIKGRQFTTKLGDAMSLQLGQKELQELIDTLNEVKTKYYSNVHPS